MDAARETERTAPRPTTVSEARWDGYRVDSPGGRIGFVEALVPGATNEAHSLLLVRAGRSGRMRFLISTEEIELVEQRTRRIVLRRLPALETDVAA